MQSLFIQAPLFGEAAQTDALGEAYSEQNAPAQRRAHGITLTPEWLVGAMLDLAASRGDFDTIVDCGAGSGRFAIAAATRFPQARVIAVEVHAEMLALLRQRLSKNGLAQRVQLVEADFREATLALQGRTLFVGNPPYVRHHDIEVPWKAWYRQGMARLGISASQLAGAHAHFMLRAAELMRDGDVMLFVTAAEWLDNGYGQALRQLCTQALRMSLRSLWLAPPGEPVFADALVSSAVVEVARTGDGSPAQTGLIAGRRLQLVRQVDAEPMRAAQRWSPLCREGARSEEHGIEVGELFRVTRGQVTGLNEVWVLPPGSSVPLALSVPAVTRAREIIDDALGTAAAVRLLRRVVNLPQDLDSLPDREREAARLFIAHAQALGADRGYIARHRKPWYRVDMRAPPAAIVSYMGRRPPVFRANPQRVSFLNIAHGLYPRGVMPEAVLRRVLHHLNTTTDLHAGRMYGGGLAKFEPSDVARLRIPAALLEPVE